MVIPASLKAFPGSCQFSRTHHPSALHPFSFSPAKWRQSDALPTTPSLILSSNYSTSSIMAPLHTSFPLPGPPSPCSSAQSGLWAKCVHLRGAFHHLWGCLPWNCPWCQKWRLLPGCEWMLIEGERQFQVQGGVWVGRHPRRPLRVAFRCQWLPLWTTQTWSWTGSGDHPGLSRPECGGLWPCGSFTTLRSFWWVREISVTCRQLLVQTVFL